MRKRFFLFLFLVSLSIPAFGNLFLKDNLKNADVGDYLVTIQGKTYSLLLIKEKYQDRYTLEEISIPAILLPNDKGFRWKNWLSEGAPKHTSWVIFEVDVNSGDILEYYSFSRRGWLEMDDGENIFSTILTLPFTPVPKNKRKKRGPAPSAGELDRREFWSPPIFFEGEKYKDVSFTAYSAKWPKDGGDLAGKIITAYLPHDSEIFPSYFPYWLEISNALGRVKIRVADTGKNLISPKKELPRRPPKFLDSGRFDDSILIFKVKSPDYFHNFKLWAINLYKLEDTIALDFEIKHTEIKNILRLEVRDMELKKKLEKNQYYRFLLAPKEYPEIWTETRQPFLWDSYNEVQ